MCLSDGMKGVTALFVAMSNFFFTQSVKTRTKEQNRWTKIAIFYIYMFESPFLISF